jgi:hypothetical protein
LPNFSVIIITTYLVDLEVTSLVLGSLIGRREARPRERRYANIDYRIWMYSRCLSVVCLCNCRFWVGDAFDRERLSSVERLFWIHLGFSPTRRVRIVSYLTPDTARRCESIIPLACRQTGQRTACSRWANSRVYTSLRLYILIIDILLLVAWIYFLGIPSGLISISYYL